MGKKKIQNKIITKVSKERTMSPKPTPNPYIYYDKKDGVYRDSRARWYNDVSASFSLPPEEDA